jgi:hypothetical protein
MALSKHVTHYYKFTAPNEMASPIRHQWTRRAALWVKRGRVTIHSNCLVFFVCVLHYFFIWTDVGDWLLMDNCKLSKIKLFDLWWILDLEKNYLWYFGQCKLCAFQMRQRSSCHFRINYPVFFSDFFQRTCPYEYIFSENFTQHIYLFLWYDRNTGVWTFLFHMFPRVSHEKHTH